MSSPVEVTWLGHACWSIRTAGHTILVDPFLDDSPTAPIRSDVADADTILITHGHFDHVADANKIAKRTGAKIVAVFEIASWFSHHGVRETLGMNLGGSAELPFGKVKLVPALHSSQLPDGSYGGVAGGFVIETGGKRIYIAGDTSLFSDMQLFKSPALDLAILPIGDLFTMGPDDSLQAIRWLSPKQVAPSHFGTWPPIAQDAAAWAERVRQETSAQPIVTQPGQLFTI